MWRNSKNENTWNIVKLCQKNTKIGNQAPINVPLAKKKLNPKIIKKKKLRPALGKRQSTVVNHGQQLCRELSRDSGHKWRLCRRRNSRAVGTVDGSTNVTLLAPSPTVPPLLSAAPRQRLDYAEGAVLPTARPSAKVAMPWVPLCQERLSAKLICAEGPIKSPSQWDKLSAKPEFLVVLTYLPEFICRRYITLHSVVCRQSHRRFLGEMNPKQLTPILLAILLACIAFPAKSIYSLWHSIIYFFFRKKRDAIDWYRYSGCRWRWKVVGWWRYGDIIYRQYPVAAGWGGDGWEQ
jgi:hypothetical protein